MLFTHHWCAEFLHLPTAMDWSLICPRYFFLFILDITPPGPVILRTTNKVIVSQILVSGLVSGETQIKTPWIFLREGSEFYLKHPFCELLYIHHQIKWTEKFAWYTHILTSVKNLRFLEKNSLSICNQNYFRYSSTWFILLFYAF